MEDVKHTRFIKYIGFLYSITLILCLIFFNKQVDKKLLIGLIMIDIALVVLTTAVYFLTVTHPSKIYKVANIAVSIILIIKYPIVYNIIYK